MGEAATPERLTEDLAGLRKAWDAAGRGSPGPRVTVIHNPVRGAPPLEAVIDIAGELGVERVLYHVFDGDRDQMLRRLDRAVPAIAT